MVMLPHAYGAKQPPVILGHGKHQYKLNTGWGKLEPTRYPVKDCHEMVIDKKGRIFLLTNDVHNNILVYNRKGKIINSWGTTFPGAHGLSIINENGTEYLWIADNDLHKVFKTTLDGRVVLTISYPADAGLYGAEKEFVPTETTVAPNGDVYIADGYGKDYVLVYDATGKFKFSFGGKGTGDAFLKNAHGITLDDRKPGAPTLLVTSREQHCFKRYTLDGKYLATIPVPGAWVCRPVIKGQNLYAAVLQSENALWKRSGFITILDEFDKVVSNPGGSAPLANGAVGAYQQTFAGFSYPHDVCVDDDGNIFLAQWNSDRVYPYKLQLNA
ncbi:MAG: 6-bladed beta-propeller [Bacteroidetes bacterium]|nr:MAG: 6-bladed beta-propeller [Bacteroidota bacterium]